MLSMRVLQEYEAEQFLKRHVPVARSLLCRNEQALVAAARKLRFPLVLKITGVLHKTDVGGVRIAKTPGELEAAYVSLLATIKKRKIKSKGILAQEFITGAEVIIGIRKDTAFGHAIMLGSGGVHAELLRDVSFRICPISEKDAKEMIGELKMRTLLTGFRGGKPINMKLLVRTLVKISKLPLRCKAMEEMDINPFIINDTIGKIADARIVFS